MDNLTKIILNTYNEMDQPQVELALNLKRNFTEYFLGKVISPHEDLITAIEESGLDANNANLVMDYSFLNCCKNSIENAALDFVSQYENLKYDPAYSFTNFLLLWDKDKKIFVGGDELGTYSPLIIGLVNHFERTKELKSYVYSEDQNFLGDLKGFRKVGLLSVLAYNSDLITGVSLESLNENLKKQALDITTDKSLAAEAANTFIFAYKIHKDSPQYKKGIGNFLERYDLTSQDFLRKRSNGQYKSLFTRLFRKHGSLLRNGFIELLDDPLKTRVDMLTRELGNKGILQEDRIRLLERLANENLLQFLDMFSDDGSDIGDILLAARLGNLTEEEKKLLCDVTSEGRLSLGKYLGFCKIPIADTALKYDARRCFTDLCSKIDPNSLSDEILESVLLNKIKEQYYDSFKQDPEKVIHSLKAEIDDEKSEVRKILLEKTLEHFELRKGLKKFQD